VRENWRYLGLTLVPTPILDRTPDHTFTLTTPTPTLTLTPIPTSTGTNTNTATTDGFLTADQIVNTEV
jgi:hypothetical protein